MAETPSGILTSGGRIRSQVSEDHLGELPEFLSRVLQVRHLVLLIGAGASAHLGSPRIRGLSAEEVLAFLAENGESPDGQQGELIPRLFGEQEVDLERLMLFLVAASGVVKEAGSILLQGSEAEVDADSLNSLMLHLNRSLAKACDLPSDSIGTNAENPLASHREFFRRLLRIRRGDLPRVRVFTTNYDLLIERALDEAGIPYFDGFVGTVNR